MVNPVGSYRNTNWTKNWSGIKKQMFLTPEQESLISGSLLGDGTMRIGRGSVNANFKVEQGLEQEKYVMWKYSILKPLVFTGPKLSFRYTEDRKPYPKSWWFRTVRHPILTEIYNQFYTGDEYRTGRKFVSLNIKDMFDPLALSVWIMDDGSYSKNKIDMSTYSFSLGDIHILQRALKDKFSVDSNYYRDRDKGHRMYCNTKGTKKLVQIIRPYIITSMMYKIGSITP